MTLPTVSKGHARETSDHAKCPQRLTAGNGPVGRCWSSRKHVVTAAVAIVAAMLCLPTASLAESEYGAEFSCHEQSRSLSDDDFLAAAFTHEIAHYDLPEQYRARRFSVKYLKFPC